MGGNVISNKKSPPHRLIADKREIKNFPKLPSATSFIYYSLDEIVDLKYINHLIIVGWHGRILV